MRGMWIRGFAVVGVVAAIGACDGRARPPTSPGAEAAAQGGPTVQVAQVEGDEFAVVALREASARAGAATRIAVVATPKEGWKINLEYPAKLKVVSAETFAVERNEYPLADAVLKDIHELRFEIPVTPGAAGPHPIELLLKFGLCDASRCVTRQATLGWTWEVGG